MVTAWEHCSQAMSIWTSKDGVFSFVLITLCWNSTWRNKRRDDKDFHLNSQLVCTCHTGLVISENVSKHVTICEHEAFRKVRLTYIMISSCQHGQHFSSEGTGRRVCTNQHRSFLCFLLYIILNICHFSSLQLTKRAEGEFLVMKVSQRDSGAYLCEAESLRGSQRSIPVILEVIATAGNRACAGALVLCAWTVLDSCSASWIMIQRRISESS